MSLLPKNGVGAEIGVAFGDFTKVILELSRPKHLYLVDLWEGERYEAGFLQVSSELANEIADGQVHILRGMSIEAMERLPDAGLDWVYIDTNHSYRTTLAELIIAERKVKPGGIIAGHDFCTGNVVAPVPYGVVEACAKFAVDHGWEYHFLTLEAHGHFSFGLKKTTA